MWKLSENRAFNATVLWQNVMQNPKSIESSSPTSLQGRAQCTCFPSATLDGWFALPLKQSFYMFDGLKPLLTCFTLFLLPCNCSKLAPFVMFSSTFRSWWTFDLGSNTYDWDGFWGWDRKCPHSRHRCWTLPHHLGMCLFLPSMPSMELAQDSVPGWL